MIDQETTAPERIGLWDYLGVLRRRWRLLLLAPIVVVAATLVYSFVQTPQFVAYSDVLLEPSDTDIAAASGTEISSEEVATQVQVVTSLPVARLVQKRWSLSSTPDLSDLVTVQAVGSSRILRITARDTVPARAARTVNTIADAYLDFRQRESLARYAQASERLSRRQTDAEVRLDQIDAKLADNAGDTSSRSDDRIQLEARRRTLLTELTQIATQLEALNDSLTAATTGGEVLRAASVPTTPVSPKPVLNGILGALIGLMIGAGAALLRDRLDDVVRDEEMARRALGGAVVLGRIPRWDGQSHQGRLVSLVDPHSPVSEAYQILGVNVRFMLATARKNRDTAAVVVTTSGQQSDGKTVTACNLAVAAARLGMRVVIIDGDLRRAGAAARFGLGDTPGLSDLLASDDEPGSYLIDVGVDNLRILPAGTIPPNPVALLSSARMRQVLAVLAADADLVVVDSPPVVGVADALELCNLADQVIAVVRDGVSRRRELVGVLESLRHAGVPSVGIVYNAYGESTRLTYTYAPRERAALGQDASPVGGAQRHDGGNTGDRVDVRDHEKPPGRVTQAR